MPTLNRTRRSPQPRSCILLLALLAIIVLSSGSSIATGTLSLANIHVVGHIGFSSRIESSTSTQVIMTKTNVSCNATQVVVNQTTSCIANVADSSPASSLAPPTGKVIFSQTGISRGASFTGNPCTLATSTSGAETCTVTFSSTTIGTASIAGAYEGDALHEVSTSAAEPISIGGFTISAGSALLTLFEGTPASVAINVYSINGFPGTIELSASCTSHDVKVALTSTNVTIGPVVPEQSLTLTGFAPSYAVPGNYTITVIGTNGSLSVRSSIVAVILSVPLLSAPSFVSATPGSLLTFRVNATDSDKTRILLLTADPLSLPNGAYFTSVTGNGTLTGIFDWALSQKTRPANYTLTFSVSDDRGGTSTAQVVVDVLSVNRSSTLPLTSSLRYVAIAALGVAVIVFGDRIWRAKKARPVSTGTLAGPDSGLSNTLPHQCSNELGGSDRPLHNVPVFTM